MTVSSMLQRATPIQLCHVAHPPRFSLLLFSAPPAYSPVPVGESVHFPPHGDYFTPEYVYIWSRKAIDAKHGQVNE